MTPAIYQNLKKLISNSGDKLEILNNLPESWLAKWHIYDVAYARADDGISLYALVAIQETIIFPIPGLENVSLVFGKNSLGNKETLFDAKIIASKDAYKLTIAQLEATLTLNVPFLHPVDPSKNTVAFSSEISFTLDSAAGIAIDSQNGFSLLPCYIGDSGFIIKADDIVFSMPKDSPDLKIKNAEVIIPAIFNIPGGTKIAFTEARISAEGFSGKCMADIPVTNGALLFGIPGGINHINIKIDNNIPTAFLLKASLLLPFFSEAIDVKLQVEKSDNVLLEINATHEIIDLDFGTVELSGGILKGTIKDEEFLAEGEAHTVLIDLPGLQIGGNLLKSKILRNQASALLMVDIDNFRLGTLGTLAKGSLKIIENRNTDSFEVQVDATATWADFKNRMQLVDVFGASSVQDNDVLINCQWIKNEDETVLAKLLFSLNINDISGLWSFIPAHLQPSVKNLSLELKAEYADTNDFAVAGEDESITVQGLVKFDFNLPEALQLPPNDLIKINTGNADGYIAASLSVTQEGGEQKVKASIENPVSIAINFPGLAQDVPPIYINLDKISFKASTDNGTEGEIEIDGTFTFLPLNLPVTVPFSNYLEQLLGSFTSEGIAGKAKLKMMFKDRKAACDIVCTFTDTALEMDLFDLIAGLTRGMPEPPAIKTNDERTIDIDIPYSFGLHGFSLQLGSLSDDTNKEKFKFSIDFGFSILEVEAVVAMELSDKACTIGFKTFEVPLRLPVFPLKAAEISGLNTYVQWNDKILLLQADIIKADSLEEDFSALLQNYSNNTDCTSLISTIESKIDNLETYWRDFDKTKIKNGFIIIKKNAALLPSDDLLILSSADLEQKINEILKRIKRNTADLKIKKALLIAALSIRSKISEEGLRNNYEGLLEQVTALLNAVTGVMHVETDAKLLIKDAVLKIPFSDPRGISIEGGACLTGFADDDTLKCLEGIELGLGLSSDRIYFFAKSLGTPIAVNIGTYEAGNVSFTEFSIGYGFTKNSFSVAFSGKVNLSERLQNDADSSDVIGFGIRPPRYSAMSFRLDLIPVPGPVPVMPFLQFDLDLQTPGLPVISNTENCTPNWDGLQFIIPDIIRFGFKRAAFSPVMGILPVPNFSYAYDFSLGNNQNGLTVICDNFFVPVGIGSLPQIIPVPMFIEPSSPYFDNLCIHINIAGFAINFHMQRPLPQLNPLALFELLGILSDPLMPVDPDGPLANTIKISVTDTYIKCPEFITYLAPGLKELNKKEVNIVLNLGTAITAFQQVMTMLNELQKTMESSKKTMQDKIDDTKAILDKPTPDKVLALIPPELRKLRFEADLGGFMASMIIVLSDVNDTDSLKAAFRNKNKKRRPSTLNNFKITKLGRTATEAEITNYKVPMRLEKGQRVYDPADDINNLFKGIEFENFNEHDITSFPVPGKPMRGVIAGAYMRIFSQRYRFMGALYEDGSFGMITAINIEPLKLSVAGIAIKIGMQCKGRIKLEGRRKKNRYNAAVTLQGFAEWDAIPGMVHIKVGKSSDPVQVRIENNGTFNIKGNASVSIYNGNALLNGNIDVSETHCFVTGNFIFNPQINYNNNNLINFTFEGLSRIGPGNQFEMGGAARLTILDRAVREVKASVSNNKITLEFLLAFSSLNFMNRTFGITGMQVKVKGEVFYNSFLNTGFNFEGSGKFAIRNPFSNTSLFAVDGKVALGFNNNEGVSLKCLGNVDWFGMNWIGGGVELNNQAVKVFGSTKMSVLLTSSEIAALNIDLAHLVFNIDLTGFVTLNSDLSFSVHVKGSWMLGVGASTDNNNCFPLASQIIDVNFSSISRVELIRFRGLEFLPASDLLDFNVVIPGKSEKKIDLYSGNVLGYTLYSPLQLFDDWRLNQVPLPDFFDTKQMNINLIKIIKDIGSVSVELRCENWRPYLHIIHNRNTKNIYI